MHAVLKALWFSFIPAIVRYVHAWGLFIPEKFYKVYRILSYVYRKLNIDKK